MQQHSGELMECLESRARGDVPIQIPNAFINSAHKWSSPPCGISQMRSLSIICLCWVSQFCIDLKDPATNDTDRGRKMRDLIFLMRKSSLEMLLFDTLDGFKCLNTSCIYHRLQQMALFFFFTCTSTRMMDWKPSTTSTNHRLRHFALEVWQ